MDAYPEDYVTHNLPLLLLSGLQDDDADSVGADKGRNLLREGGFRISADLPPLRSGRAQELRQQLLALDSSTRPWNGKDAARSEHKFSFRVRSIGRTYTLPPRKAPPPPHSPRLRPSSENATPPPPMILHSMLSPLTPSSPLYADGIMTPLWVTKHQARLPSFFVTFFSLGMDTGTSTIADNKIKSDINNVRNAFSSANYKSKVVVVLMGDEDLDVAEADERIANIRRVTNLDPKSLFFVPADSSMTKLSEFAKNLLTTLYPVGVEYYRDLSKHARRKRNRNAVPPPTVLPSSGASRLLPLQGWNVRYEFKLGVFAEFRQEMDAAVRNYEAAYDSLFGSEIFQVIPSWSPRFNETRMFSDIIAIRMIRCFLWSGQTTNAARRWLSHRNRIRDLVNRRGAGLETYGWEAWQSIWSRTMANLIQQADVLPLPDTEQEDLLQKSILVHSEKTLTTVERFAPFESLHHEGYWFNLAQKYTQARRVRALRMPEEDRTSPGRSPASAIANKAHLYDTYLTLQPHEEYPIDDSEGYDYTEAIIHDLDSAVRLFSKHGQTRMVHFLELKTAIEQMRSGSWQAASRTLGQLWQDPLLRTCGWWTLLNEIGQALWTCLAKTNDRVMQLQLRGELVHPLLSLNNSAELNSSEALDLEEGDEPPIMALITNERLSSIATRFAFATAESHVGKPIDIQVSVSNVANADTTVLRPAQLKIVFDGGLKPVYLLDTTDHISEPALTMGAAEIVKVELAELGPALREKSSRLSIGVAESLGAEVSLACKPGQTKIYQLQVVPREAGEVSVASITMSFQNDSYEAAVATTHSDVASEHWWESRGGKSIARLCGKQRDVAAATILPKPPRVEIEVPELRKAYFTNEEIELQLIVNNMEDETVTGSIASRLISLSKNTATLRWGDDEMVAASTASSTDYVQTLQPRPVEDLPVADKKKLALFLTGTAEAVDHELEVVLTYTLPSAPETTLRKVLTVDIPVIRPFEANFGFHSRRHAEVWPSFFQTESITKDTTLAVGLKQQYSVSALVCSFATEDLEIESVELSTQKVVGEAACTVSSGRLQDADTSNATKDSGLQSLVIHPEQTRRFALDMTIQKYVLGESHPVAVDFVLNVAWKRYQSSGGRAAKSYVSTLQVPRFLAPSSEPRVLLHLSNQSRPELEQPPPSTAAASNKNVGLSVYTLTYTVENPSLHFLTFNLTMESSEEFAFSGPKARSLSLVPISRHDVSFNILPNTAKLKENAQSKDRELDKKRGPNNGKSTWMRVNLEVVDAYFGQTLRVQPASDGVRVDKSGNVLIRLDRDNQ